MKDKLKKELYKIEYGNVYGRLGGTGHQTHDIGKSEVDKVLKKLNKKWDYTTLFKKKGNDWDVLG